jgi:putative aminopeptidase FrvX
MNTPATLDLLQRLAAVHAPSGREEALGDVVAQLWAEAGTVVRDGLGNLSVTIGEGGPHVAFVAHLDEVGFIVRRIREDGFVRLQRVGGIPERVLAGQEIVLHGTNGPVRGVVGTWPHHYTPDADKHRVVTMDGLYLDLGVRSARAVTDELGVKVGDHGTYPRTFWTQGDTVFCNALDDRAGLAAITGALADVAGRVEGTVTFIASVQEEFSIRGLVPTVRRVDPDVLYVIDISPATDTPEVGEAASEVRLGAGPVMHLYSFHGRGTLAGVIPPPRLVEHVATSAAGIGLDLQRAAFHGGLTDGSFAQLENDGIPSIELGVACRSTHTAVERCSAADLEGLRRLVGALATNATPRLSASTIEGRR